MARATKCDRCGDLFEGRAPLSVAAAEGRLEGTIKDDLCDDCAEKHERFMDGTSLAEWKLEYEPPIGEVAAPQSIGFTSREITEEVTVGPIDSEVSDEIKNNIANPEARNY